VDIAASIQAVKRKKNPGANSTGLNGAKENTPGGDKKKYIKSSHLLQLA
jgi:hypothetical protein